MRVHHRRIIREISSARGSSPYVLCSSRRRDDRTSVMRLNGLSTVRVRLEESLETCTLVRSAAGRTMMHVSLRSLLRECFHRITMSRYHNKLFDACIETFHFWIYTLGEVWKSVTITGRIQAFGATSSPRVVHGE